MPRSHFLDAITDEVDQALQALQTARRLLREMDREAPRAQREALRPTTREGELPLRFAGITVAEASRILGMSEDHVRRLLRSGEMEGTPYSGKIGWRLDPTYVVNVAEQRRAAREGQRRAREELEAARKPVSTRKRRT